jgi:hypothetical protein
MRLSNPSRIAIPCALAALAASSAGAASPQPKSRFEKWTVYTVDSDGDRICYAATPPDDAAPLNTKHGEVDFMIATWKSGSAREQPMLTVGYPLKLGAPTSAKIGSDRFRMFTDGSQAFIAADEDEPKLIKAMQRGYSMRIETVSEDGTATAYEFPLAGVTAALKAVSDACK